ncbi:uncharacterized protein EV154DRAFT_483771 [Mucor mucedo]|uniref:uncharacterized protein n=1 Tax=Mucor mucedo TaxID=29922 RepID=UPI002220CB6D|nr:uncharacterized protein EV154DRAFT_483771 [Mucor mucedo]KAI7888823.1 hypothetical protein EV154DRAFT_483771 [Mucor mucedo]
MTLLAIESLDYYWNAKFIFLKKFTCMINNISDSLDKMIKQGSFHRLWSLCVVIDYYLKDGCDKQEVGACLFSLALFDEREDLITYDNDYTLFELDAKFILLYDDAEYAVSCTEFAPYAGPQKIKVDQRKLIVEGKAIYNQVMTLGIGEGNEAILNIKNIQVMALSIGSELEKIK